MVRLTFAHYNKWSHMIWCLRLQWILISMNEEKTLAQHFIYWSMNWYISEEKWTTIFIRAPATNKCFLTISIFCIFFLFRHTCNFGAKNPYSYLNYSINKMTNGTDNLVTLFWWKYTVKYRLVIIMVNGPLLSTKKIE